MNRITIFAALLLTASACKDSTNRTFTVSGTLKGSPGSVLLLEEATLGGTQPQVVDSARIAADGKYSLTATALEENLYILRLSGADVPLAALVNDKPEMEAFLEPANREAPYTVKGSPASQSLIDYSKESNKQLTAIDALLRQKDSLGIFKQDSLAAVMVAQAGTKAEAYRGFTRSFLTGSPSPAASIYLLGIYDSYASGYPHLGLQSFSRDEVKDLVAALARRHPKHTGLAALNTQLQTGAPAASGAPASPGGAPVGKPAPDFVLPDANGKSVSLSSLRGKWVLVDFWASWCGPCRQENPAVVAAFNAYKGKNFTVLGVSLDNDKFAWTQAVQKDGLAWTQVSDLQKWESPIVRLYEIGGIPANVLIDPQGVVVAKDLRGAGLLKVLGERVK